MRLRPYHRLSANVEARTVFGAACPEFQAAPVPTLSRNSFTVLTVPVLVAT